MLLRIHTPSAPLSLFVDYLWFQEGAAPAHAVEGIVPSGTTELVLALHDRPLRMTGRDSGGLKPIGSAVLCGTHAEPFAIDTPTQTRLIGVHFRPGGAFPFFSPPAAELRDARLPLADLWGSAAAELGERLAATPTIEGRFALLEKTLLARAARPLVQHPAVAHALAALDGTKRIPIASLTRETGLSARRFIELFRREVGLTPRLFARVRRLQKVLGRLDDPAGAAWVEVALEHGYFDQPHLVRDFRRFTGFAPTAYLPRRAQAANHVALSAQG
jgi:AraC-like DNA-binding protein